MADNWLPASAVAADTANAKAWLPPSATPADVTGGPQQGASIPLDVWGAPAYPYIGGMIGGALGGVPGATAGGMVGGVVQQGVYKAHGMPSAQTLSDYVHAIGGPGVEQGAYQVGGNLFNAGVAQPIGRQLHRWGIGKAAEQAGRWPGLHEALFGAREPVGGVPGLSNIPGLNRLPWLRPSLAAGRVEPLRAEFAAEQAAARNAIKNPLDNEAVAEKSQAMLRRTRTGNAINENVVARGTAARVASNQARSAESAAMTARNAGELAQQQMASRGMAHEALASERAGISNASQAEYDAQRRAASKALQQQADADRVLATSQSQKLIQQANETGKSFSVNDLAEPALQRAEKAAQAGGGSLSLQDEVDILQQVYDEANHRLSVMSGLRNRPPTTTFTPGEVDLVRQGARDATRTFVSGQEAGAGRPVTTITHDLLTGTKDALYGGIEGLGEARTAEKAAIKLNQAAIRGTRRALEARAMMGDQTAEAALGKMDELAASARTMRAQQLAKATSASQQKLSSELAQQRSASSQALSAEQSGIAGRHATNLSGELSRLRSERALRVAEMSASDRIALARKIQGLQNERSVRLAALPHLPPGFLERQKLMAEALRAAELRGGQNIGFHLGIPGAVGTAAGVAAHNPLLGLGTAAGLGTALQPWFLTRAGLAMTGPFGRFAAQQVPRSLGLLVSPPPDSTNQGGY